MRDVRYPALYQVNTRVWLTALSRALGRAATLDDVPDGELDALAARGFDWVWLLSVWQTGEAGRKVSLANPAWRQEFAETLPDLTEDDIVGSGFAVADYRVHAALGGDAALARMRVRLAKRGLKLMLDFVPNHTALDHRWVDEHPDYFVAGTADDLAREPENFTRRATGDGELILAYGRDPYFPGWPDTLQLDYSNPALQEALCGELVRIAGQCDGLRCDMAILVLPEVFERTWGRRSGAFWPEAIARVRAKRPGFCFMAEAYWDLEWTLQQQGFEYAYDKRLYDRLREGHARPIREHLSAGLDYQDRLARFLENHDEPRAAATFPAGMREAAAAVTFLAPGLRFFHQGQFEGRRVRISPHLGRGPYEPVDAAIAAFYERLLAVLRNDVVRQGPWRLLACEPAWDGNWTWDCLIASAWGEAAANRMLVIVNYADNQSQGYVRLPWDDLVGRTWRLHDLLGTDVYERDGGDLAARGLYVDTGPWQAQAFQFEAYSAAN